MSEDTRYYRTGQFAEMSGVTKRALRYYDRIGLLKPGAVSESGQRLYSEDDLLRLQQIVTLKFIGFSLEQIRSVLEQRDIQLSALLAMQREWLEDKIGQLRLAVQAIREAERVVGQGKSGSEKMKRIIEVIEVEAKRDWQQEFLVAAVNGNEEKARIALAANKAMVGSNLYAAAAAGEPEAVRDILSREPALATKPGGPEHWEPILYLSFSCFLKNPLYNDRFVRTAKLLLEHGANANAYCLQKNDPYKRKLSCLYGAAGLNGNAAVAEILLEAGADPNDGESVYHAAELPRHECLELLYRYGADVNATPALFRKLDFDDYAGVKWFLEHGADLDRTLGDNGTPLHWAVYRERSSPTVELLLKHGARINAKRPDGKTAYALAVRYGQRELAELLRSYGASTDTDRTDRLFGAYAAADRRAVLDMLQTDPSLLPSLSDQDRMMLIEFAELNKDGAVSLMLETGFDSSISKEAGTALHVAAWFGHIETVRVLLRHGTSLSARNAYGGTPLSSAIHGSVHCLAPRRGYHAAVVELLIQAGAAVPEKAGGSRDVYELLCERGAAE